MMAMSESPLIHLDLEKKDVTDLDLRVDMPISEVELLDHEWVQIRDISSGEWGDIVLEKAKWFAIDTFGDIHTLDASHRSISAKRGLGGDGDFTLDLVPPLPHIYDALDLRDEYAYPKKEIYSDLYRRALPLSLQSRRAISSIGNLWKKHRRQVFGIFLILIGLSIPSLLYTKSLIETGYASLSSLSRESTFEEIRTKMTLSRNNFERANILLFPYRLIPWNDIHLAKVAIDGGLALTRGIDTLFSSVNSQSGSIEKNDISNTSLYRPDPREFRPFSKLGILEPTLWIEKNHKALLSLAVELENAGKAYKEAAWLDHPRATEVAHVWRGIEKLSYLVSTLLEHEDLVMRLLWAENPERYIVFNQNKDEIRAGGWFPGSIISFTMYKGNISDFRTDDVYYYDWNLYPFRELPPPGLALITGTYGLRDVNYYGDFRETLEKANNFVERSGDPTITMGLAVNQGLVEDILKVTGPVSLSWVTIPFTSENFSHFMSTLVEARYGEETSAKDILRRFVDALITKIHEKRAYEEVLTLLDQERKNGEILFASRDKKIDALLASWRNPLPWDEGWASPIADSWTLATKIEKYFENAPEVTRNPSIQERGISKENWVYPLLTSISGNKSDRYMERTYSAETHMISSCMIENKLTFTHRHTYTPKAETDTRKYLDLIGIKEKNTQDKMVAIQGKWPNKTYIRILAPLGASLTGATNGIEISKTPVSTEYAWTLETPLSGTSTKILRYTLTLPGCEPSVIKADWYRQPGLGSGTLFISR
jgi:hypothetical protein